MCNIWKKSSSGQKELGVDEIEDIFADPLLSKLEWIQLSGGEPFLRKDIAEICGCTFEISPETFERLVSRSSRGLIKSVTCVDGRILVNGVEVKNIDDVIYSTETWARVFGWACDPVKKMLV
jgi:hypothetical protein